MPISAPPVAAKKELKKLAMDPAVYAQDHEAPVTTRYEARVYFCLPTIQRYPIDTVDQIKQASQYFLEHEDTFTPDVRREYAVNFAERARTLQLEVPPEIEKYAGRSYGPEHLIEIGLDSRRLLLDKGTPGRELLEKVAEARQELDPEVFARALREIDRTQDLQRHYDRRVMDPWLTTFGTAKTAEAEEKSWIIGTKKLTSKALKEWTATSNKTLTDLFGPDMAKDFQNDCCTIFDTLPLDQKKLVMKLVNIQDD